MYTCQEVVDNERGGLTKVILRSEDGGSCCEVFLFGATLTSWVCEGTERIFVSPNAVFNGVKAIRGGIPLVFPQFGQPSAAMAQHGFVRTSTWAWECGCSDVDGEGKLVLRLSSSPESLALWPHAFALTYTVTLTAKSLSCQLSIENPASASGSFACQALLHTYIRMPEGDVSRLLARGFQSRHFVDKMAAEAEADSVDAREEADVDREVDRIYLGEVGRPFPDIDLRESGSSSSSFLRVSQRARGPDGSPLPIDVVFWNAWIDKSAALPDLGEGQYKGYVCVEPGLVSQGVTVPPGGTVTVETSLTVPEGPGTRRRGPLVQSVLAFARQKALQSVSQRAPTPGLLAQISPSPEALVRVVLDDLVPRFQGRACVLVDMGAGDGRWLQAALERFPAGTLLALGVEMDAERIACTRRRLLQSCGGGGGGRGPELVQADFMKGVSVRVSDVVVAYLSREGNRSLGSKLETELHGSGCLVVAVGFAFVGADWAARAVKTFKCPESILPAYLYKM